MDLTPWAWLILPLGITRLLQIALVDRLLHTPREWLLRKLNPDGLPMHDPDRPYLSYLLECPWCLSVWLGGIVMALVSIDATRPATLAVLAALALSLFAVLADRAVDVGPLRDRPPEQEPTPVAAPAEPDVPPVVAAALRDMTGDNTTEET